MAHIFDCAGYSGNDAVAAQLTLNALYLPQSIVPININGKCTGNSAVIDESSQTDHGECDAHTMPITS